MIEPINPSVWRKASRNTAFSVRAVRIASGEFQACPPRVVRGAARQAAIASSLNHTRQAAPLAQTGVIRRPVRHLALLLRDVVATNSVGFERQRGSPIRMGRLLLQPILRHKPSIHATTPRKPAIGLKKLDAIGRS